LKTQYKCDGTFKKNTKKQNSPESVAPKPVNILKVEFSSGNSSVADGILFFCHETFSTSTPSEGVKCRFYDDCAHDLFAVTEQ